MRKLNELFKQIKLKKIATKTHKKPPKKVKVYGSGGRI